MSGGHGRYRELIAARLDRPLSRAELRSLNAHLRGCAACVQLDREYREQRALLRTLPASVPPRDLWARTSAALDREVARGSYRQPSYERGFGRARRRAAPSAALATSMAAIGVITAVAVMQIAPTVRIEPATPVRATPFKVAPQRLAFVGRGSADIAIYRTQVDHVCPAGTPDCDVEGALIRTPVGLPPDVRAQNVALSPGGHQLALVGRYADEDVFAIVMLDDLEPPTVATLAPAADTPEPDRPSDRATVEPSAPPPNESARPTVTATPDLASPEIPPSVSLSPGEPSAPPPSALPGLRVVAILEDVDSAGAPPAWSPDGGVLAFSAMPADGSHGPDVYVWSPADERARPITSDHASYFASWAGNRIVASRFDFPDDKGDPARIVTVVLDPQTLEERIVDGPEMWLPAVNEPGTLAVVWHGQLDMSSTLPSLEAGALYLTDWTTLDPFGEATPEPEPTPSATPTPSESPSDEPSSTPESSPSQSPTPTASASATATASSSSTAKVETRTVRSAQASQRSSAAPTEKTPRPDGTLGPGATQTAAASPDETVEPETRVPEEFVALEPERDWRSAPVLDWQVRWASDDVLGVWIADAPGSSLGWLVVRAVDRLTAEITTGTELLTATLARRGFTLGIDKVAWVAPADANPDGELHVRTWGEDGIGRLLLQAGELEEVVPAF